MQLIHEPGELGHICHTGCLVKLSTCLLALVTSELRKDRRKLLTKRRHQHSNMFWSQPALHSAMPASVLLQPLAFYQAAVVRGFDATLRCLPSVEGRIWPAKGGRGHHTGAPAPSRLPLPDRPSGRSHAIARRDLVNESLLAATGDIPNADLSVLGLRLNSDRHDRRPLHWLLSFSHPLVNLTKQEPLLIQKTLKRRQHALHQRGHF
mmetsp:Transcript_67159/g.155889  ORF Transcript_67159/g.155889 Transcript_67159/m.155889 type:complete len:207 (-) Transcript_67159:31-651(-)